jgi:hypothetical protein
VFGRTAAGVVGFGNTNQTSVAVIVSTKPAFVSGMAGGEDTQGQVPLDAVGVVTVKASAENGPIHPGDLLVTSAAPGYAMKAGTNSVTATIIGRALGLLGKSTGVIKSLVTLQ